LFNLAKKEAHFHDKSVTIRQKSRQSNPEKIDSYLATFDHLGRIYFLNFLYRISCIIVSNFSRSQLLPMPPDSTSREWQKAKGSQPTAGRLVGDSRLAHRYVFWLPLRLPTCQCGVPHQSPGGRLPTSANESQQRRPMPEVRVNGLLKDGTH